MENELTFAEIWRAAKKKLWLILLISIVFAIGAVIAFRFVVNPVSTDYRIDFTLSYPNSESQKYPDGTPFYYQDIISLSYLEEAKASDARFSAINIQKMVEEDHIAIQAETREVEGARQYTGRYTLIAQHSYFANKAVATAFLRAVANVPVAHAKARAGNVNYLIDYALFDGAFFEDRIALLTAQRESLLGQYDEWIRLLRDSYPIAGKTLKGYRTEVVSIFSDAMRQELISELNMYGYVSIELLPARIAKLKAERAANDAKIQELERVLEGITSTNGTGLSEKLAEFLVRNVEIDNEIEALTEQNVATFEARIENEYEKLRAAATTLQAVATVLYEQESRAYFDTTNASSEGGTSYALVAGGTFVLTAFVVGAIVCSIEFPKMRKTEASTEEQA